MGESEVNNNDNNNNNILLLLEVKPERSLGRQAIILLQWDGCIAEGYRAIGAADRGAGGRGERGKGHVARL